MIPLETAQKKLCMNVRVCLYVNVMILNYEVLLVLPKPLNILVTSLVFAVSNRSSSYPFD